MARPKQTGPKDILAALDGSLRHDFLVLAIPSHDRDNVRLGNQEIWADEAMRLFSALYGGATAFRTFKGIFRSESGEDLVDEPILVESYADREDVRDPDKLRTLLAFVRRMKAGMSQESVLLVANDFRWFL